jgi:hypothetical protein
VASSVAVGAAVFFFGFLVCVVFALAVILAVSDGPGKPGAPASLVVGVAFCLVTAAASFGAAYVVGRRLPDPPAGGRVGLAIAAATPVVCYLLLVGLSLRRGPGTVATELQAAGLLAGSAVGARMGERAP